MRVTADTNIYVSAFQYAGKPLEILELARSGAIRLSVSEPILAEVKGVLGRKFLRSEADLRDIEEQIREIAEVVTPGQPVDAIKEDPADDRILECAIAGKSDYLVTGDKHLLKLGQFQGVKIVPPAEFVEIQKRQGQSR
jgi:putative PIN family toxin of toxin-antitoxin system